MRVLVTGGLGYIGSHTIVKLLHCGYEVICIDNLINSNLDVKRNIEKIAGKKFSFHKIDLKETKSIKLILNKYKKIDLIIHFASLIYVPESILYPNMYYQNNIFSLLNIINLALEYKSNLIYSSSSTVYGTPEKFPLTEEMPLRASLSPYGNSKRICEELLIDIVKKNEISIASLRYFNPAGAHESCLIGEKPLGEPIHLLPYITQTAIGIRNQLSIFGRDYDTRDGTCVRDYIHVNDVAEAHIESIPFLINNEKNYYAFNIGYGKGISVLEMIDQFQKSTGFDVNYKFCDRRPGDVAELWSSPEKAKKELSWSAKHSLEQIVLSAWKWEMSQKK